MALGTMEIVLILAIVLVIFGPKRLPELARSIGGSVREYRRGLAGDKGKKPKG